VEIPDLRGDLHLHTTWSDGKGTLEQMVDAGRARGYEYLAICDHAQRLRGDTLAKQHEAIAALAERAAPMRILRGIEVNIRADGSLDVDDETLAGLDWVMASVHFGFDRDPTPRVLAAMDNPHVDCIGHVTNRRINTRPPSDVAIERVVERALATGTFLEINSQPDRLDLRDVHARLAGEAGVRVVVSSDGHSVGALRYVEVGIAQARRAWLTKEQVLNTRPWAQIEKLIA
jgi:DNA polymerase (family 10)